MPGKPNWPKTFNPYYMNEHFTNTDQLIQYLDGELEGEALTNLQQKIETDKNLAAELENLRLAKIAVKTYGLKNTVRNIHTEMMKELQTAAPAPVIGMRRILQYSFRVAAMLVLVAGAAIVYQYYAATPAQLYNDNFHSYNLRESRGNNNYSKLEDLYKAGNYTAVMDQFKQLAAPTTEDYFLEGIAALNAGNASAAIQSFLALQQLNKVANTHLLEEDATYYLALAYLKNNEPASALPIFEKIHADEGHPYHRNVSSWFLRKLRRLAK